MGGLIGINDSWSRNRGVVGDFDLAIKTGTYKISNFGGNNNPNIDYGIMVVSNIENYILQTVYSLWANRAVYRTRTEKEEWSSWTAI